MTDFGTPGSFPAPPVPPSSGARTGPPWEQPGAFVQRWIDTAKTILLDPKNGFSNVRREGGLGAPITYYLVGFVISLLASFVWNLIGFGGMGMGRMGPGGAAGGMVGALLGLVFGFVVVIIGVFIITGIVHLTLSLLGGARYGFETTLRTLTYAFGSSAPIGIVPFCGGLIGLVWGMVCAIMGLADMQETTPVKSAIAILTPFVLCCVLIGIMVTIFGFALAGLAHGVSSGMSQ
jgi:hypothetical protein